MSTDLIQDGNFNFPNYPLGNGKRLSDMPTLQLESNHVSSAYVAPWLITGGYVTAYGLTPNERFDPSWPSGSNAVLLGPLAENNLRGTLHQKADVSTRTKLLLSFYSRIGIQDAEGLGRCLNASLDVQVDNKSIGIYSCGPQWQRKDLLINISKEQSNVDIAFKDASSAPPIADCVSAIAAITLLSYEAQLLEKISGDEQFSYVNRMFENLLTVRLINSSGKPVSNAPITFDVTSGHAKLTTLRTTHSVIYSNSSTGEASVTVYGEGRGPVTVTVSAPAMRSLVFNLFVGPERGQVELMVSPMTIVVRQLGSDAVEILARSISDHTPLSYFALTKGTLSNQLSFTQNGSTPQRTPLGKTQLNGKTLLPKIWRIGATQIGGSLTVEYDGGNKKIPILFKH